MNLDDSATSSPSLSACFPPGDGMDFLERGAAAARQALEGSTLAAGTRMGPFIIEEFTGSGGAAEVYLARQEEPVKRRVAVKVPHWLALGDEAALDSFHAERHLLGALDHPNIARVLDAGFLPDGRPWLAMDYVEGLPVHAFCDEHQLSMVERCRLLRTLCLAVRHAHQRGVIHRDLKPSHVIVSDEGDAHPVLRVIDFGIAGRSGAAERRAGTPGFASPEQMSGHLVDARSDVYALGCIAWKLFTGHTPETSEKVDPARWLADHPDQAAAQAGRCRTGSRQLIAVLRSGLAVVVAKAVQPEPAGRYQSVDALAADLDAWLLLRPVSPLAGSARHRARCFFRRNRAASVTGGLALAALIAGGFFAAAQFRRALKAEDGLTKSLAAEKTRREESEMVTGFTARLLNGDAVDWSGNRRTTVAEMLEAAAAGLQKPGEGGASAMQGRLSLVLAEACMARGLMATALPLTEIASSHFSRTRGHHDHATLQAMLLRGQVLERLGRNNEARTVLEVALRRTAHSAVIRPPVVLTLAAVLIDSGREAAALELMAREIPAGAGAAVTARAAALRAGALARQGDIPGAVSGFTGALTMEKDSARRAALLLAVADISWREQPGAAGEALRQLEEDTGSDPEWRDHAALRRLVLGGGTPGAFTALADRVESVCGRNHPLTIAARLEAVAAQPDKTSSADSLLRLARQAAEALGPSHPLSCRGWELYAAAELPGARVSAPSGAPVRQALAGFFDRHQAEIAAVAPHAGHIRLRLILSSVLERDGAGPAAAAVLRQAMAELRKLTVVQGSGNTGAVLEWAMTRPAFAGTAIKRAALAERVRLSTGGGSQRKAPPPPLIPGLTVSF